MKSILPKIGHVVIMGPPGGGKGTISKKLLKDFPFYHLSTGDMLRSHVANKTQLGDEAKFFMDSGKLVPDRLIFDMIKTEACKDQPLLIDGFPRNKSQATELLRIFDIKMVVCLVIPHQTIVDRISSRWIHMPSGRTYAYDYNPPKQHGYDDVTGEALIQREDDKPSSVATRLDLYEKQTKPVIDVFQANSTGLEFFHGTESNVIYPKVKEVLIKHFS